MSAVSSLFLLLTKDTYKIRQMKLAECLKWRQFSFLLTSEKGNVIIFGDSIPKGINTRLLNTNLIKSKAISKCFPGASSIDFIHTTS